MIFDFEILSLCQLQLQRMTRAKRLHETVEKQ